MTDQRLMTAEQLRIRLAEVQHSHGREFADQLRAHIAAQAEQLNEMGGDFYAVLGILDDFARCKCGECKFCKGTQHAFDMQAKWLKHWAETKPEFY